MAEPPDKRWPANLPALALVVLVFLGVFGIAFLLFWYLVHKPYRDAIGPPPPP